MSEKNDFESLKSALQILSKLEDEINEHDDDYTQLRFARQMVSTASDRVDTVPGERKFKRAMGKTAGVAMRCGRDDLAETALEIGGELDE